MRCTGRKDGNMLLTYEVNLLTCEWIILITELCQHISSHGVQAYLYLQK
jgi:hypothetical protein